jgi:hypothetical protein
MSRTITEVRKEKFDSYKEEKRTLREGAKYIQDLIAEHGEENVNVERLATGEIFISINRWKHGDICIDGHFWVEDPKGKILNDLTGKVHIDKFHQNGHSAVYLRANPSDEARFISKKMKEVVAKNIAKHGGNVEQYYASVEKELEKHIREGKAGYDCFQNATLTAYKTGGVIRYGHFGAMFPDGNIYWYFGHPDNTYEEFEKRKDGANAKFHNYDTHKSQHPSAIIVSPPRLVKKQKPNEKCACGSGNKFKKCCGEI